MALQVRRALGIEVTVGRAAQHQRQHDLGEQHRLQVRLGRGGLRQPPLDIGDACLSDGVTLAVRPVAGAAGPAITWPSRASRDKVAQTWP